MSQIPVPEVFLCHNSKDKREISKISTFLEGRNIKTWMDKNDFRPFEPWECQLASYLQKKPTTAVFIGSSGLGPYQVKEVKTLLQNKKDSRMGLVLLPSCSVDLPNDFSLRTNLEIYQWIDFHEEDSDPVEKLVWGVTGKRPVTISISELYQKHKRGVLTPQSYSYRLGVHLENLGLIKSLFEIAEEKTNRVLEQIRATIGAAQEQQVRLENSLSSLQDSLQERLSEDLKEIVAWLRSDVDKLSSQAADQAQRRQSIEVCRGREKELYEFTISTFIERVYTYLLDPRRHKIFLSSFPDAYTPPEAPDYVISLYVSAIEYISQRVLDSPHSKEVKQEVLTCFSEIRTTINSMIQSD